MQTTTQLYNALSRLSRLIHRMEHRAHGDPLQKQKIHRGQTHLLMLISQNNGAKQRDLVEEMDIRPSSMTEMLLKMEQAGLIERRQDENDQRAMRIFLTEAGKETAERSNAITLNFTTTIFDCLTPSEQIQLLTLIEKLSTSIEITDTAGETRRNQHPCGHPLAHHHQMAHRQEANSPSRKSL